MKRKVFSILALLLMAATGAMAQTTYTVTVKDGTEDAAKWSADPNPAAAGQTVTVTYTGTKKVKSVKAKKKAGAPASKTIDLSTLLADYEAQDGDVLTGTLAKEVKISIADGATVTIDGVSINADGTWSYEDNAGITCEGDATIILSGTNTVKGFHDNYSGIHVPENKTLTVQGDGSLTASSNGQGAGIGGGYYGINCGNIVIKGGTVTATGGQFAAGIGGGNQGSCGNITITNSVTKVTATKGSGSYDSIGHGYDGECESVTIGDWECYYDGDYDDDDAEEYLQSSPLIYQL